jgi:WD40 repeat protein/serine/threonine protein kinase
MPDRSGQLLGNYRLVRFLGQGGFAEVYLGEHRYLRSRAALKVLRISLSHEEAQRFLSEAQMLVNLKHPNIVRVLDFGIDQSRGMPFLVMEYATGGTARQRHPQGSRLSLATTVSYINQVSAALQHAHNHHIIHRDVKPENILIDAEQQVLLSDFGLALLAPSPDMLSTQQMAGTLPYTAPEQLRGKPSFASDQYALGAVAYEWLCGARPFDGNPWEIVHKHLNSAPPPLRELSPELPAEVEAVVLKALAKDPQQRFASVQNFARALEQACKEPEPDDTQVTIPIRAIQRTASSASSEQVSSDTRTQRRIFLSAASADAAFAAKLKADLGRRGILLTNDAFADEAQELDQENVVRQAIRAAALALVVISPQMHASRRIKEHMRIAAMYQRRVVFIWTAGDDIAPRLLDAWGTTMPIEVIDARGTRYQTALDEIADCLGEDTMDSLRSLSLAPTLQGEPRNPYKGLRAFTGADAADFFGRGALIDELMDRMQEMLRTELPGRLLAVAGPSGSGKSSVVMAGLLPKLQNDALTNSAQWIYLDPLVPGRRPCESLALALSGQLRQRSLRSIREELEDDAARGLHLLATQIVRRASARVVLMIDQFEEIFSPAISERERRHFIDLLVTAATERGGPVIVLLTLRADFYDRPMQYPALSRLIEARHTPVLPMDIEDLREVIEGPAALPDVQLIFEGNLVGDLLFETQGQAGALPLLEFTLDQLFQLRNDRWLTLEAYQSIGGVKGALVRHAENTYASLPSPEHRRMARALFLRLIDPGAAEQETTRRRATLAELSLPDPKQATIISAVADAFIAARLLFSSETGGERTIEVSHEALIREWPRLSTWLREARGDIILQRAISADAADWLRRGRPVDRLYRGTKLAEAQDWAGRNTPSSDETAFLQASAEEYQRQENAERSRQAREIALQRRVVQRQRLLIAALSIFSIVVIVLAAIAQNFAASASHERDIANNQALQAISHALAAQAIHALDQNRIDQALLLGIKADQVQDSFATRDSLLNALEHSPHLLTMLQSDVSVDQVAFRPDSQMLLTLGSNQDSGDIILWNMRTRKGRPLHLDFRGGIGAISYWALAPNGQILAGANDQGLWLWDARTGARLGQLESGSQVSDPHFSNITPLAFSPDGKRLASSRCAGYDSANNCTRGEILLWDMTAQKPTSQQLFKGPSLITDLAFSPDGSTLLASTTPGATSTTGSLQLWDVASATLLTASFAGFNGIIWDFAFSPDGRTLAASDNNSSIFLWNVATQKALSSPLNVQGVQSLAFSPDGKMLAAGTATNTVQLWDTALWQPLEAPLTGHQNSITSLAFSPDGKMLASSDNSGAVLVWDMAPADTIQHKIDYTNRVFSAAYSPDGRTIAVGDSKGAVTLRDAATGRLLGTLDAAQNPASHQSSILHGGPLSIESLAFSPDGRMLAAGRFDGTIFLWDAATRQPITHFHGEPSLLSLTFGADNLTLAAGYASGDILLWNTATGQVARSFKHAAQNSITTFSIALSRDGRLLATGNKNAVTLWNTATGKQVAQLKGHQASVRGVAFSPDGHTLASIDNSIHSTIILWDIRTMKPLGQPFSNADPNVALDNQTGLAFSPDGRMLAAGGEQSVTIWNITVTPPERLAHPFHLPVYNFQDEHIRGVAFSPQGQQLLTISDNYTFNYDVTLWDVTSRSWQAHACSIVNRNFTLDEWQQFVAIGTYQRVCPNLPVDGSVIQDQLKQAHLAAQAGHTQDAQALYTQALQEAQQLGNADVLNNVCWSGSIDQFARLVLPACDQATAINPYNGQYHDSRGLARALTGNRQGAITDFKFFVDWARDEQIGKPLIDERKTFVRKLTDGQNPFDAKTLQKLYAESS